MDILPPMTIHGPKSDIQDFVVVGLGEVLWDLLPSGKQFGGAPANFAYHAKAFGAKAHVVSCVGDDSRFCSRHGATPTMPPELLRFA